MSNSNEAKWAEARANPGVPVPVGIDVVCDFCNEDHTLKDQSGGIIFESKAVCPSCVKRLMPDVEKYWEAHLIRAKCPEGVSFANFVRQYRGDDASIMVVNL